MGGVAVLHPQDCLKDRDNLLKSRRTPKSTPNFSIPSNSSPNFARSDVRKRSPPAGVRKNNRASAGMVVDPPAAAVAKNLVMGQVKILKRGEPLNELTTASKDANDRKVSNGTANDLAGDRRLNGGRKVQKKVDKEKKRIPNSSPKVEVLNPAPKIEVLKVDDFALSSTNRLGPDPEMVPKQVTKNMADFFFAGSAFVDSPPPSSVPLPGFFTKNFTSADPSSSLRRMLGLTLS